MKVKFAQLCLTLCHPMDYIFHGILQARILEWIAVPFSGGSSQPMDHTQVSCIVGGFLISWATREAQIGIITIIIAKFNTIKYPTYMYISSILTEMPFISLSFFFLFSFVLNWDPTECYALNSVVTDSVSFVMEQTSLLCLVLISLYCLKMASGFVECLIPQCSFSSWCHDIITCSLLFLNWRSNLWPGSMHCGQGPSLVHNLFLWIKFYWNTITLSYSDIVCGCLCLMMELGICSREYMVPKDQNICIFSLYRKFCQPLV